MAQTVSIPNQILMRSFSLNEVQAEIYKVFLVKGILTLGEISLLTQKSQEECSEIIKGLLNQKLISLLPGAVVRYRVFPPYQGLFSQVSKFQIDFEKNNGELIKTTEKFVSDLKSNIQTQIKEIKEFIQKKVEDSKVFDKEKDSYVNELSKYPKELGDISSKFTESLSKMYLEYLKTFEDRINKIKGNLEKNISDISKEIKDVKQKNSEDLEENVVKLLTPQKDSLKNLAELLNSKLNVTIEGEHKILENLGTSLTSPIAKSEEGIINYTNELQNRISTFLNQQIEFVNATILELKDKVNPSTTQDVISNLMTNNSLKLKAQLENQQGQLSKSLGELKTKFKTDYLDKAKNSLETTMKDALSILDKGIVPVKEELAKIVTQNIDAFEATLSNLRKSIKENIERIFEKIIKDYDSKIQISSEAINRGLTANYEETKDIVSKGNQQRSTDIMREIEKIQQRLQDFKGFLTKAIEDYRLSYVNILETVSTNVTTNLDQFQNKSMDPINKTIDKIISTLQEVNKENQDTAGTLRLILNEFDRVTTVDTEKTWTIVSTRSIIDYITDMLTHVNRSIFLIIPTLSMLKLDLFKKIEPNILIHIFTYFNNEADRQALETLRAYKNIRIWQVNTKFSLYCAFRDTKDLICAPFAENEKEIVGFVSEQKEYLNLFQKIIGPFFHAISQEMKLVKKVLPMEELPKPKISMKEKPQKASKEKPKKGSKEKAPKK